MSTINFSHLRLLAVFATVVEAKSFAGAARHLHTSRSRVSEQVSQLELALGVRLLQRSTRQLLVTREGNEVYEQARVLPAVLKSIESVITPTAPQGRVVITMNHDIAHKVILPVLGDFKKRHPLINIDLRLDDNPSDLIAEQIDLGIRIGPPKDNSLIGRVMHEESFSVFASPEYLATHGTPRTIQQLQDCQWIFLHQLSQENSLTFRWKKKTIDMKPDNFYRCNSPHMMQKMVESGLGVGALLPSLIQKEIKNETLIKLLPSLQTQPLVFTLIYPSRQHVPQRTRVLIDYLLDAKLFSDQS